MKIFNICPKSYASGLSLDVSSFGSMYDSHIFEMLAETNFIGTPLQFTRLLQRGIANGANKSMLAILRKILKAANKKNCSKEMVLFYI